MTNTVLKKWESATNSIAKYFIKRYFGSLKDCEWYWICDDVGSCLYINDYYFNLNDIIEFIRNNYSSDKMFEYYEYSLKCCVEERTATSIASYKKLLHEERKAP